MFADNVADHDSEFVTRYKRAGLVVFSDGNHHMALEECPLYTRKRTFWAGMKKVCL